MSSQLANMTLVDCARRLGAMLLPERGANTNTHAAFQGVSTDSRSIAKGELFVALSGENFDGHDYVASAAARGAAGALVSHKVDADITQLVVSDTMFAYGKLAQYWRSRFTTPIIALTGSNGKTTVKEMLRSILVAHEGSTDTVLATAGNLNNNIGLPQMLLQIQPTHKRIVLEMGMNHLNEIDYLTRLAAPNVAIINMAGTAHIGELGSRNAIAQAKGEIYAGLRADGIACICLDDKYADYWKSLVGARRVVSFGTQEQAQVRGELHDDGLTLHIAGNSVRVVLHVSGEHNQRNAVAAAAAAHAANVPLATIAAGLASYRGIEGRLQTCAGIQGATVIDDTYNANPDSIKAAIAVLAKYSGRRVLVLGDMGELGADAAAMHVEIGKAAHDAGIDTLLAMGELATHCVNAFGAGAQHYPQLDELVAALKPLMDANTTVLVKGSRFMKMERVVTQIIDNNNNMRGQH